MAVAVVMAVVVAAAVVMAVAHYSILLYKRVAPGGRADGRAVGSRSLMDIDAQVERRSTQEVHFYGKSDKSSERPSSKSVLVIGGKAVPDRYFDICAKKSRYSFFFDV